MSAVDLHQAERRLRAARADVGAQVARLKRQAIRKAKSPYVIAGAIASVALAGVIAVARHSRQAALSSRTSRRASALPRRPAGESAFVKWGTRLLPILGAMAGKKAAKPDPRSFPVVIEKPKDDPAAKAATGKGLVARQWHLIKQAFKAWSEDYAPSMGAALSYYTLFSLAPLLIIVIAVAGMIFGQEAAQGEIVGQLRGVMGEEGATAIEGMLKAARHTGTSVIATVIGFATLLLGATAVFGELQNSLDRIWRTPAPKKESGLWHMVKTRLLSFGMVLGLGFLLIVSLVFSAGLSAVGKWYGGWFEGWEFVLQLVNFVVSFGLFTLLFAMIYKLMPRARISWHDVWIGAAATSLMFNIGKILIGLYLGKSSLASGFGAAGSLVVLLAWVYYSAQIFLLGAEYTWVYAKEHGSLAGKPEPPVAPVPERPA